jgi:hypothetical protein
MAAETKKEIGLEIAHVLFIDIAGYSKLLIDEQRDYGSSYPLFQCKGSAPCYAPAD